MLILLCSLILTRVFHSQIITSVKNPRPVFEFGCCCFQVTTLLFIDERVIVVVVCLHREEVSVVVIVVVDVVVFAWLATLRRLRRQGSSELRSRAPSTVQAWRCRPS